MYDARNTHWSNAEEREQKKQKNKLAGSSTQPLIHNKMKNKFYGEGLSEATLYGV